MDALLRKSGMVHKHLNDQVLGGGQLPQHIANAPSDDDDDGGGRGDRGGAGGGAGAGAGAVKDEARPWALPWARPSVKAEQGGAKPEGEGGAKAEREAADTETSGGKRAKCEGGGARVVLHGSEREARQLLHGHCTFDAVVQQLRSSPDFAAAVLRCVTSAGAEKLVSAINALPRVEPRRLDGSVGRTLLC